MKRYLLGAPLLRNPDPEDAGGAGGGELEHKAGDDACPCKACSASRLAKRKHEKERDQRELEEKPASMAAVQATKAELQAQIDEIKPKGPPPATPEQKRSHTAIAIALVVAIPLLLCAGVAVLLRRKPELAKVIHLFPGARRAAT